MVRNQGQWNVTGGQLIDAVCREVDEFVGRLQDSESWRSEGGSLFAPRMDLAETDQAFFVEIDLPGLTTDGFNIEVHEGRLSVSGERREPTVVEGKKFHRVERMYGKFHRSFQIGTDIEAEKISAEYKQGVLKITVPKCEKVLPKKIHVSVTD